MYRVHWSFSKKTAKNASNVSAFYTEVLGLS